MLHHWQAMTLWIVCFVLIVCLPAASQNQVSKSDVQVQKLEARALLSQSKALALKIPEKFQQRSLLNQIGVAQANAGDLEGAFDSAQRASPSGTMVLDAIGEQLAELNDLPGAKALGQRLKPGAPSFFFSEIAKTYAVRGKIDEALEIAVQIPFLEGRSYALEDIAVRQAANGDETGARKTFALARAAHQKGLLTLDDLEMIIVSDRAAKGDDTQLRATIMSWEPDRKFSAMIGVAEQLRKQGNKTRAATWLRDALRILPEGPDYAFFRYYAIPIQVRLGAKESALAAAEAFSGEMRIEGYMAVAVTCAEEKEIPCVNTAVERMESAAKTDGTSPVLSQFVLQHMLLNITAALIDNEQFEAAGHFLAKVEAQMDDISLVKPQSQLQRALMLSKAGKFEEARALALKMRPNEILDKARGEALRTIAWLQTKANGSDASKMWALLLSNAEDRAYALLGVAQALLDMDTFKLPYSAIQFH